MKLRKPLALIVIAGLLSLVPISTAEAANCTRPGYPPNCTVVGSDTPPPVNFSQVSQTSSECDDFAVLVLGQALLAKQYTCSLDRAASSITVSVESTQTGGYPLQVKFQGDYSFNGTSLNLPHASTVSFQTSGFLRNSKGAVYISEPPVLLGTFTVSSASDLLDTVTIPATVPVGKHYLQFAGHLPDGRKFAIGVPTQVVKSASVLPANQKKVSVSFATRGISLSKNAKNKLDQLARSIPANAKNVTVFFRGYFWGGKSFVYNRSAKIKKYLNPRISGEKYLAPSPKYISRNAITRNLVDVTVSWTR